MLNFNMFVFIVKKSFPCGVFCLGVFRTIQFSWLNPQLQCLHKFGGCLIEKWIYRLQGFANQDN